MQNYLIEQFCSPSTCDDEDLREFFIGLSIQDLKQNFNKLENQLKEYINLHCLLKKHTKLPLNTLNNSGFIKFTRDEAFKFIDFRVASDNDLNVDKLLSLTDYFDEIDGKNRHLEQYFVCVTYIYNHTC